MPKFLGRAARAFLFRPDLVLIVSLLQLGLIKIVGVEERRLPSVEECARKRGDCCPCIGIHNVQDVKITCTH